jgi:ribokinase
VELDVLVSSDNDPGERYEAGTLGPPPRYLVSTDGSKGGSWESSAGESGRWEPAPLPGPVKDSYGCGDSFAAGLTFGLGSGLPIDESLDLAARCGAACLTGRGPYEVQLTL